MVGLFGISVSAIRTLTPSMTRVVVAGRVLVVVFMAQRSATTSSFAPVETLAWSLAPGSSLRELLGLRGCRQRRCVGLSVHGLLLLSRRKPSPSPWPLTLPIAPA